MPPKRHVFCSNEPTTGKGFSHSILAGTSQPVRDRGRSHPSVGKSFSKSRRAAPKAQKRGLEDRGESTLPDGTLAMNFGHATAALDAWHQNSRTTA